MRPRESAEDLLAECLEDGIRLWVDGENLRYRAPEGTLDDSRRRRLRRHKAALTTLLGQRRKHARLSFAQQRLWFLDQLHPANAAYHLHFAWRLHGPLERRVLAASLGEIVNRHEVLRTSFTTFADRPFQVISRAPPPTAQPLPLVDLMGLPQAVRDTHALRLAGIAARQLFDLVRGPLFRPLLLRLDNDQHLLAVIVHHIVYDGWSHGVFARELEALYRAFAAGRASPLPELPLQYSDFAIWQRRWLRGELLETQLAYWRHQLDGASGDLPLPADRPRAAVPTFQGSSLALELLDGAATTALKRLARAAGASLHMVLLAALMTFLHRLTGRSDILVGTPVANRTREELEGLIGFFVNTLVMRGDCRGNPRFRTLLERVRELSLEAYAHQDLPFERLVAELDPERDVSRNPLFQVTFALLERSRPEPHRPHGLDWQPLELDSRAARTDLALFSWRAGDGLRAMLEYSTALFDATTAARLARSFNRLLRQVAKDPERRLAELVLVGPAERHQLLVEWNHRPGGEQGREPCLHELFNAQAKRAPDAVAVCSADQQLSYRALDHRSRHLTRRLRHLGVAAETTVGICLERRPEMVTAVLAVLRAGGTFVPLEETAPARRRRRLLVDSGTRLAIARPSLAAELAGIGATVVTPEGDIACAPENGRSEQRASTERGPTYRRQAAYVLYTSGSSGTAKGVVVEHRQIVGYVLSYLARIRLQRGASYAMVQPLSVDSALSSLLPPLITGGTLHLVSRPDSMDPGGLATLFARRRIDVLKIAPGHLAALLRLASGSRHALLPRQRLVLGGEAADRGWMANLLAMAPACEIFNHYGPTEATVGTSAGRVDAGDLPPFTVPIGRPLSNSRAYVVNRHLQPVSLGVPGELLLAGACLARGYLHRPALTSAAFIPNPFAAVPGERLYATGDVARYLTDGRIEILGRRDRQVKIRGHRVEPAEIEAHLTAHPAVRACVVGTVPSRPQCEPRLVAYVVVREVPGPPPEELRRALNRVLPPQAVPDAVVVVEELPRTAHGKIDRRALAELAPSRPIRPSSDGGYLAPRTPGEELVAGIWSRVLGFERIGVHDNFFDLGGHSLLAAEVVARARRTIGRELSLRTLFEHPTVAELAAVVDASDESTVPELHACRRRGGAPLSFAQERHWDRQRRHPTTSLTHRTLALRLRGDLDPRALAAALRSLAQRHQVLRSRFFEVADRPMQRVVRLASWKLSVVDLARLTPDRRRQECRRLMREQATRPFALARDFAWRTALVRLERRHHLLLISLHLIAFDGWSRGILQHELSISYTAFAADRVPELPRLPVQIADYAIWQRGWLTGEHRQHLLTYWRHRLAGLPTVSGLPYDRPRPGTPSCRGGLWRLRELTGLAEALRDLGRDHGASLFMVLLATFLSVLHRLGRQVDLAVGTPVANRSPPEVQDLIGPFTNFLVLRCDVSGAPGFLELLRRVRETVLDAFCHQALPFGQLVAALGQDVDDRHPIFQVAFGLNSLALAEPSLGSLEVSSEPMAVREVDIDLDLSLFEIGGELSGVLIYNAESFETVTIRRLAERFADALEELATPRADEIT